MKTLKSILEELDRRFPTKNDCTGKVGEHNSICQGCTEIIIGEKEEITSFIRTALEQAFKEVVPKRIKMFKDNGEMIGMPELNKYFVYGSNTIIGEIEQNIKKFMEEK